jgi:hypothetical protein
MFLLAHVVAILPADSVMLVMLLALVCWRSV